MHLVITDSGLGGLSVCAGLERALRGVGSEDGLRLAYVNAWPEEGRGYNDLPDVAARAHVFERALLSIHAMQPSLVVIACNTLSILYELTGHRQERRTPVLGIIDAGVDLFVEALEAHPTSSIVLIGTRTTVESGVHRSRLLEHGIGPGRVGSASCHGLATAIEADPRGVTTSARIDACADRASAAAQPGVELYVGLCCTHYGMVADRIQAAVAQRTGRVVEALDPNARLVDATVDRVIGGRTASPAGAAARPSMTIEVISKVALSDAKRENVAGVLELTSPATARALRSYVHVPDLF